MRREHAVVRLTRACAAFSVAVALCACRTTDAAETAADGGMAVTRAENDARTSDAEAPDALGGAFEDHTSIDSAFADATSDSFLQPEDAAAVAVMDGGDGAPDYTHLPYATELVSYEPGEHAGFGQAEMPGIVLGPPQGKGTKAGSLDVLALGVGGEVVLSFGPHHIVDGSGPDFVVFENAFWPGGDATRVFAEPAEVSVSEDGKHWTTFECDSVGDGHGVYPGCAGWSPTLEYEALEIVPVDPSLTGGDAFDLKSVGLQRARFVKIRDLSTVGAANTAGFDLDAVGLVHYSQP